MSLYVFSRDECALAVVRAHHYAPYHCPLVLISNIRRANFSYTHEELDDIINDGMCYELWGLVKDCINLKWDDMPSDYYYNDRGGHRAIWLAHWFRPLTLEWEAAERTLSRELEAVASFCGIRRG